MSRGRRILGVFVGLSASLALVLVPPFLSAPAADPPPPAASRSDPPVPSAPAAGPQSLSPAASAPPDGTSIESPAASPPQAAIIAAASRAADPDGSSGGTPPSPQSSSRGVARLGLSEHAGISLLLLDVEVLDRDGKPIQGLTKDDFVLRVNGAKQGLYSLDDLCACTGTGTEPIPAVMPSPPADESGETADEGGAGPASSAGATGRESQPGRPSQDGGTGPRAGAGTGAGAGPGTGAGAPAPGTGSGPGAGSPTPSTGSGPGAGAPTPSTGSGPGAGAPTPSTGSGPNAGSAGGVASPSDAQAAGLPTEDELKRDLGEGDQPSSDARPAGPVAELVYSRYIIYFDFSQLTTPARTRALDESRRWLRGVRQPQDAVMVVAYSGATGVERLQGFSRSLPELLNAVDNVSRDEKLRDPFPDRIEKRIGDCNQSVDDCIGLCRTGRMSKRAPSQEDCAQQCTVTPVCETVAQEEFDHSRASLTALKEFLASLDTTPGRKELIYFQENGLVNPTRMYRTTSPRFGDNLRLVEEIGAEANMSRTRLYTASMGNNLNPLVPAVTEGAVGLGSLLAEATGGGFNRDLDSVPLLTASAHRTCSCFYRLGILPPESPPHSVIHVKVRVRGRALPYRYRVEFLSDVDRRLRTITAVLRNPGSAKELDLAATVVPLQAARGQWDVSVLLAFDLESVALLPEGDVLQGVWEAGALLENAEANRQWELMSSSSVHKARPGKGAGGAAAAASSGGGAPRRDVLHEGMITALEPGSYRLRAFVHDPSVGSVGGAEVLLELPATGADSIAGPVLLRGARRCLIAPLQPFSNTKLAPIRATEIQSVAIPAGSSPVPREEIVEVVSWICPRNGAAPDPASLVRFVSKGGVPLFKLHPPVIDPAGQCYRVTDLFETNDLEVGDYRYTLRWRTGGEGALPVVVGADFSVARRERSRASAP